MGIPLHLQNDALEELRYLSIKEDFVDMKEALRCTGSGGISARASR